MADRTVPLDDDERDEARMAASLRDAVLFAVDRHSERCDDATCLFRENMIAYLAHAVGLTTAARINEMEKLLDEYNRTCPRCTRHN